MRRTKTSVVARCMRFLLLYFMSCGMWCSDAAILFTTDDCQLLNNANNSCKCVFIESSKAHITCSSNSTTSTTSAAQIRFIVNEWNMVTLFCGNATAAALQSLYAQLSPLGKLHSTKWLTVHDCLPLAPALERFQLTPISRVQLHFHLPHVRTLAGAQFGRSLQNITALDLFSEQKPDQPDWQLAPDLFAHMPKLSELDIRLAVAQLPTRIFEPLPLLKRLQLVGNLSALPCDALRHAKSLIGFSLWGQQLQQLSDDAFLHTSMLQDLNFTLNVFKALPTRILWPLTQLEWLALARNQLTELPPKLLWWQTQLERLDLSLNRLQTLPAQLFANTTKLKELLLQQNQLRHIDAAVFAPLHEATWINLSENQLITLAPHTFAHCQSLWELQLFGNKLRMDETVSCAAFVGLEQLHALNVSNNRLTHLCPELGSTIAPQLLVVEFNNNQFQRLDDKMLRVWNRSDFPLVVMLAQNPWQCDCEAEPLHNFVKTQRKRVHDSSQVRCSDAQLAPLIELTYRDFCPPELGVETGVVLLIVTLGGVALIAASSALCYYKYKLELKIWLYAHQWCLWCVSEAELDRERNYDAFISYSHMDEEFVKRVLMPGLEQGTPPFKLCIHTRDWLVGAYIPEQIIDSVEQSRRTIIVLSQHFIESDWARMEFRTAHQCSLEEGRARIILIIYGELANTELLDAELQAYLKMNACLKWYDPWFWRKLRYAMPHKQRTWAHNSDSEMALQQRVEQTDT